MYIYMYTRTHACTLYIINVHVYTFGLDKRTTDPVQREDPTSSDSGCQDIDSPPSIATHNVRCELIHLGGGGGGGVKKREEGKGKERMV